MDREPKTVYTKVMFRAMFAEMDAKDARAAEARAAEARAAEARAAEALIVDADASDDSARTLPYPDSDASDDSARTLTPHCPPRSLKRKRTQAPPNMPPIIVAPALPATIVVPVLPRQLLNTPGLKKECAAFIDELHQSRRKRRA
jgi:hypothetical protein